MTFRGALRAATFALFATAARVAAPTAVHAQDLTCESGDLEVRDLDFRGNNAFSDDELERRVITTPSSLRRRLRLPFGEKRCLNRDELPRDVARLVRFYKDRGYYGARVDTLVQPLGKSAVRVVFNIAEGSPVRVGSYSVTGLSGVQDSARIVRRLRLRVGDPFDIDVFRADMDTIVQRLRDDGYYRAEVLHAYETNVDSLVARASITVMPGKVARFGFSQYDATNVDGGPAKIDTAVVRRIMRITRGDVYSDRAIVEAQRNLYQLGAYRHIEIAPLPDSQQVHGDTVVDLGVRLAEDYLRGVDSEYGWATLDCFRIRAQYTDKNLLGTARRLDLNAQLSRIGFGHGLSSSSTRWICTAFNNTPLAEDTLFGNKLHYLVGATVRQPRLLGTHWVPALSVYSEQRGEFKAYLRSTEIGADLSATRDLTERTPLRLGYSFEYGATKGSPPALCTLFARCSPQSLRLIQQTLPIGVASAALAHVRTDNLVNPTSGFALRGEARTSASRLLGTNDTLFFNKGTGDIAWYRSLGFRSVLALRVRGGIVTGRTLSLKDSGVFIPPQERLYAGGATSVRGFQQNELGELVYIARDNAVRQTITSIVDTTVGNVSGKDTTFSFTVDPNNPIPPDRSLPLGGNSLVVLNAELRLRDPFFFPDLLQYILFYDGGDVWTRGVRSPQIRWTPGIGFRALTPVGPVQLNIGYNKYDRPDGAIYFNPNVNTLACATPGNKLTYRRGVSTGVILQPVDPNASCSTDFNPPNRRGLFQRLAFTFSIGSDF